MDDNHGLNRVLTCHHKRGDYIHGLWVCADCFTVLSERPKQYQVLPYTFTGGKEGVRQEIAFISAIAQNTSGATFGQFLNWMIGYLRLRSVWTISKDEARKQCLETLRDQGEHFGSDHACWTKDDAKELVREGICAYWDESPSGANT